VLKVCQGRSKRIGACGDLGNWLRSGTDPIKAVRMLKDRLLTLQVPEPSERSREGREAPRGRGVGQTARVLKEVQRLGIQPTMFGLEFAPDRSDSMSAMAQGIDAFNTISLELAK
jgi:hypothetical protein